MKGSIEGSVCVKKHRVRSENICPWLRQPVSIVALLASLRMPMSKIKLIIRRRLLGSIAVRNERDYVNESALRGLYIY